MNVLRRALLLALLVGAGVGVPAAADGAVYFTSDRCAGGAATGPPGPAPPGQTRGCAPAIWRVADDGTDVERITDGSTGGGGEAGVATDLLGTRLLFTASTPGSRGGGRIWSAAPDGSDKRQLTPDGTSRDAFVTEGSPTVSPGGALVAFESTRADDAPDGSGDPHLWLMAADGSGRRQITSGPGAERVPRFSPDGTRLVYFRSATAAGPRSVVSRSLAGGPELEVLASDARVGPFALAFSPDGRRLALTLPAGLHTLDLVTGAIERRAGQVDTAGWSPFGPTLYFSSPNPATGRQGLFSLDLSRGDAEPAVLTDGGDGSDGGPSWAALGVELPKLPKLDRLPPAVGLVPSLPGTVARSSRQDASAGLRYVAADPSGVRGVRVAVARETGGRCRPVDRRGRLSRTAVACVRADRTFRPVRGGSLNRLTRRLPRGRYRVWFRARDGKGNATRRPRAQRFTR